MYQVSNEFHEAVRNGEPQRALLRFPFVVFTNEDISVSGSGIKLTEIINGDTNLHYGLCSSAHIEMSIINSNNRLEGFGFGEFEALIGVRTKQERFKRDCVAVAAKGDLEITLHKSAPYVKLNGAIANMQPKFAPGAVVINGNNLYLFGYKGETFTATVVKQGNSYRLEEAYFPMHTLMHEKYIRIAEENRGFVLVDEKKILDYHDGIVETFEYAPLGVFIAPRPSILRKSIVELSAEDRMQLFDTELSDVDLTYPLNVESALDALCKSVGVQRVVQEIPNASLVIEKKPDIFEGATKRDLLTWIAEASATFARFNRDGLLELTRFSDTGVEYSEKDYISATPSAYQVKPFKKLHIRNADSNNEQVAGDGEREYLIQDNPFLKPQSQTLAAQARDGEANDNSSSVILGALAEVGTYAPVAADTFADWTVQAGDLVTFHAGNEAYKTPVYSLNMTWKGSPRVTMESTGDEKPEPISVFERRRYAGGRGVAKAKEENEEFKTWAELHIDEAEANIKLLTGSVTTSTCEYINVEVELNGLKGQINNKAEKSDVTGLTQVVQTLDATTGRIEDYVYVYDADGNRISSVQVALDGKASKAELQANYVTIKALQTTVSGLVKTEDLETETLKVLESARIPDLKALSFSCSGRATVNEIWATGGVITNATIPNLTVNTSATLSGTVTINGTEFDPKDYLKTSELSSKLSGYATKSWVTEQRYITDADVLTGVTTNFLSITNGGKITIPVGAELNLFGYKPRWNQMSVVNAADLSLKTLYVNLRLADGSTTGNINIVTGATLNATSDTITYLYRGS